MGIVNIFVFGLDGFFRCYKEERIKRDRKKVKERRGKGIIKEVGVFWGGYVRVSSKMLLSDI